MGFNIFTLRLVTKLIFTIKTVEWGPCQRKYVEGSIFASLYVNFGGIRAFCSGSFYFYYFINPLACMLSHGLRLVACGILIMTPQCTRPAPASATTSVVCPGEGHHHRLRLTTPTSSLGNAARLRRPPSAHDATRGPPQKTSPRFGAPFGP